MESKKKSYQYYVYSFSIARTNGSGTEIKNHQTNSWSVVKDPQLWKRIQDEGTLVTEEDAEKIYQKFHQQIQQ